VQHAFFGYGLSNGVTAIFDTWPKATTHS